jgi:large subunit ribosomal protein L9
MLAAITLTFSRKAGETGVLFGSVTSLDVTEALEKKGFPIDRRKIHLEEPIKQLGEFQVPVRLHKEVTVPVQVQVVAEEPQ